MYTLIKHNLTGSIFRCRIVLPTVLMGGSKIRQGRTNRQNTGICLLTLVAIHLHTPATAARSCIGVTSTPPSTDWLEELLSILSKWTNGNAEARPDLLETLSATFGNASAERGNKSEGEKTVSTQKVKI